MLDLDCIKYILKQKLDQLAFVRSPDDEIRLKAEVRHIKKLIMKEEQKHDLR